MIALITCQETDDYGVPTGNIIVSHGVDIYTLDSIVIPPVQPHTIGYIHPKFGWVLR